MGIGRKSFVALVAAGTALAGAFAAPAAAAESSGWQYTITPYLYMTSMSGTTTFGPISAPTDLNFGQVLDHLSFAAMGNFNAQNDKWAVNVDLMYAKLGATGPKKGLFNVDIEQGIYAGVLARRIAKHAEVYAGVRIVTLDVGIHSNFGPQIDRTRGVDWVDPIVGLRVNAPVSDKVAFNFMADIGGFGIGALMTNLSPSAAPPSSALKSVIRSVPTSPRAKTKWSAPALAPRSQATKSQPPSPTSAPIRKSGKSSSPAATR